jgi:hypothetical protein
VIIETTATSAQIVSTNYTVMGNVDVMGEIEAKLTIRLETALVLMGSISQSMAVRVAQKL